MTLFFRLALAVTLLALSALAAPIHRPATAQTGGRAQQLAVDPSALIIETAGGDRTFSVEIAARPDERSRGLMYRETMPADRGMLFVFEQTRPVGFWMQNTSLPLDLLFISERGRIRAILPGRPFSTDLISADEPVRFVLELNAGIAQKTGIKVGDRVRHPVIESGTRGRRPHAQEAGSRMQHFSHDGFDLAYLDEGAGEPVLLVHGFASNMRVNWVSPGWVKTLTEAGYRAIALDNRGHGASSKSHRPADYHPDKMAADAAALLDHLGLERAHVMGYSMGARVAAFMALAFPEKVATLVFGGLGSGMVEGVGAWDTIADALTAADPATITDARAKMFRSFADQTKSDRQALAACIETSRQLLAREDVARIAQPTLVAVGTTDDIAGSPEALAALMTNASAFAIEGRDHMLSVGDRTFKKRALAFFQENPL